MSDVHVAAVAGSLRDDSYTRLACRRALAAAEIRYFIVTKHYR